MNKLIITLLIITLNITNSFAEFDIKARSAILQDFYSGEILFEKEADASIYPDQ